MEFNDLVEIVAGVIRDSGYPEATASGYMVIVKPNVFLRVYEDGVDVVTVDPRDNYFEHSEITEDLNETLALLKEALKSAP